MLCRALLALLLAPALLAQSVQLSRSTVSGYVRENGRPVPHAAVYFRSNADRQSTQSDDKGHYVVFELTPGAYIANAYARGLRSCVPARVQVLAGFRYDLDIEVSHRCR